MLNVATLFLAFDFGLKRIGVAFGNSLTQTASGVCAIQADSEQTRFDRVQHVIQQWQPEALVVGVPRYPDGQPSEMTARCERFARQLEGRFNLPCFTVDERYTSAVVESGMNAKTRQHQKTKVDVGSACLILEQYFLEGR
jgi:putative Holliday junction resolvase